MLSIEPIVSQESTVTPGVTFKVRSLSKIERAKREFPLMDARFQIADLANEWLAIKPPEDGEEDIRTAKDVRRARFIDVQYQLLMDSVIKPAVLRAGVVSIHGLKIDGKAAGIDSLIAGGNALDDLIEEIFEACQEASGLTEQQRKNSESPSTSNTRGRGEAKNSEPVAAPAVA